MVSAAWAFLSGLVFAAGLALSGMTSPANVLSFLDLFGAWNPKLALVMGGALAVVAPVEWQIRKRQRPLYADRFDSPTRTRIDRSLMLGALLFGVGWGLSGLCPGPAVVLAGAQLPEALWFMGAMLVGMWLEHLYARRNRESENDLAAADA